MLYSLPLATLLKVSVMGPHDLWSSLRSAPRLEAAWGVLESKTSDFSHSKAVVKAEKAWKRGPLISTKDEAIHTCPLAVSCAIQCESNANFIYHNPRSTPIKVRIWVDCKYVEKVCYHNIANFSLQTIFKLLETVSVECNLWTLGVGEWLCCLLALLLLLFGFTIAFSQARLH